MEELGLNMLLDQVNWSDKICKTEILNINAF